jgi:hypothetical protein
MKIFDHFKIPYNKEEIAKRREEEEYNMRERDRRHKETNPAKKGAYRPEIKEIRK